ncbi:MAG: histidine ammonia-lyase [Bdellovibrionales bacterium CG10_big_fil_rev_8_21_14_0_10_45_34]|nr:MAG: histidine ammonia-lyase [Bdellovibrionales bacterium CG10_big_fil_rev_8_21_14_0_10_45_34]
MEINGNDLDLESVIQIARDEAKVKLAADAIDRMKASREFILKKMGSGEAIYGVNTGFGAFSKVRISDSEIEQLQVNLIRSHCCGVGKFFSKEEVRAIMLLRANALARGHSAIRPEAVDLLLQFLNHHITPRIPEQGSVGASGDLAPLSHLALALIGEGQVEFEGKIVDSQFAFKKTGLVPLKLQAKEGLSLINGCQVMTAVGLITLHQAANLVLHADIIGAMSLEALRGARSAFDPRISQSRPHPGEILTSKNLREILSVSSEIAESHDDCDRVQDAYSLRCMPAVHGSIKDAVSYLEKHLVIEANSSTDNPLVFLNGDGTADILSCGNFHGQPISAALDFAAISLATLANISDCRVQKLINPAMSDLPAFLAKKGGLNSGLMIAQVASASLVSENKILAHPASVDSIPTSADKEDHVSMGTIASRKFRQITENTHKALAIELLTASQGIEFLRPLRSSPALEKAHACVRSVVPAIEDDRVLYKDIEALSQLIETKKVLQEISNVGVTLEWRTQ